MKGGKTTTAITVGSLVSDVGTIFTGAMGWAGDVGDAIAGNPLLLMFVLVPIVGLGIGIFRRMLGIR